MKTTSIAALLVALLLITGSGVSEPQINRIQALSTGTAYRISTSPARANSLFIQSLPGNAAIVYVLYADEATTCVASATTQIVAYLGPGTASQPGQSFTYPSSQTTDGFLVNRFCVQGTTGDSALVSYDLRN
jgi:hypothetical protein